MKAVTLLSGGMDSATTTAIAREQGFSLWALSFRYGQCHEAELKAAALLAKAMEVVEHLVVDIDSRLLRGSALTDSLPVPMDRTEEVAAGIPVTYVPARNTLFLSFALSWAESIGARDIFIGVNAIDYSGYPDCRPEYIVAYQRLANLATKAGVEGADGFRIQAPLLHWNKAKIVREGMRLQVDFSLTSSCYVPREGRACGRCDACRLRLAGFRDAGYVDPIPYCG